MKAPGSPSSPLQRTYFFSPGALRTAAHFSAGGKAGPAPAPQARGRGLLDDLLRARGAGGNAAGPRTPGGEDTGPDRWASTGRNTRWPRGTAGPGRRTPARRAPPGRGRWTGSPASSLSKRSSHPRNRVADPPGEALGFELRVDDRRGALGLDLGKQPCGAGGRDQLDQRHLMAHAHAAHGLEHGRGAAGGNRPLDGLMDLAASLGDAAGAQTDADLAQGSRRSAPPWARPRRDAPLAARENHPAPRPRDGRSSHHK